MQTKIDFIKPDRGIVKRIGKVDKRGDKKKKDKEVELKMVVDEKMVNKEFLELIENMVSDSECIKIWAYEDAPLKYKRLYRDDVDWVAFIPLWIFRKGYYLDFLEEGTPFACCHVEKKRVEGGEVWFGCHS